METRIHTRTGIAVGALATMLATGVLIAQHQEKSQPPGAQPHGAKSGDHVMCTPADLVWKDGPESLPPGAKLAVLEGDPHSAGPFTMRLKVPAGYRIPAHHHPAIEHVTVISGTFNMGVGDKLDTAKGKALPAGGFAVMPVGTTHFAWTDAETIVQVHGIGPWGITYVDPTTDPRKKKQ